MTEHEHQWADTGVIRCSICRITKDDLWNLATTICPLTCKHDLSDHSGDCYDLADFILSRWRLVPVDKAHTRVMVWVRNQEPTNTCNACGADWPCETASDAQRRAADELTQHDQDAGIYGDHP